jgi:DHA1 family bicyclomycin/chloramphenicol resistance-like MFS transporter
MPDAEPSPRSARTPIAPLSTGEMVAMVASLSALNALSVDIMLPALSDIARSFTLGHENDRQLVVVAYLTAFGLAQLIYGPLADAFGRRIVLIGALLVFLAGSLLCVAAPSFELFIAARVLQGMGAAATRVVSMAVVRDVVSGARMAQIISLAMTLFMIVPIIAPGLGQLILLIAPWRWVFASLLLYGLVILGWTLLRLPETLAPENRRAFAARAIVEGFRDVTRDRQTMGYMLASTFMTAGLFAYVASSEQIFVGVYEIGPAFALAFASVAIAMSAGMLLNSRIVMKHGMRRIGHWALLWFCLAAALNAAHIALGLSSFWSYLALLSLTLGAFGLIAGNFNALAMQSMGRVAGSAAAMYGAATAAGGAILGGAVARLYDGTPLPFLLGLFGLSLATIAIVFWVERGRLFRAS